MNLGKARHGFDVAYVANGLTKNTSVTVTIKRIFATFVYYLFFYVLNFCSFYILSFSLVFFLNHKLHKLNNKM